MYSAVLKTNDGQDEQSEGGKSQNLSIGNTISGVAKKKKYGDESNSCPFVLVGRAHNQRGRTGLFFLSCCWIVGQESSLVFFQIPRR